MFKTKKTVGCAVKYQVVAQERGDVLTIQIGKGKTYFRKQAQEIMKEPELLKGFNGQDASLIGYIAGMAY